MLAALFLLSACTDPGAKDPPAAEPLRVVITSPADGADDVPVTASIRVTFNDAVDPALLTEEGLYLLPDTPGARTWDEASRTATLDPTADLAWTTPYRLRLSTDLGLDQEVEVLFSTEDPPSDQAPDLTVSFGEDLVSVRVDDVDADVRTYTLTTTHPLRDGLPANGTRTFSEVDEQPRLRSGDLLFDALFAMAMHETREASVEQIADGGFRSGAPTPCSCFETGEKWTYVWTRDTSYAVDLALAWVDPIRARNSLLFKLSRPKAGGPLEIVQDTGSGGSWPVSTDRAVWARGAATLLEYLDGPERAAFRDQALEALQTTLERDRRAVYDAEQGLYRGEESFLDWREQSYPAWTAADVRAIAEGQSLSTNAAHQALLTLAARLGQEAGHSQAATWQAWADDLALRMRAAFYRPEDGSFAALRLTPFNPSRLPHQEQLGTALVLLQGIADEAQAATALAAYPHTIYGPPVIWPQRPSAAIYHNRAIWPFVTAYGLLAARQRHHEPIFNHDVDSLVRGAALNLSNMENFEFLSGRPWLEAGSESGPVVNSRRQLWSVAGYLAMVVSGLVGADVEEDRLTFAPFITPEVHLDRLASTTQIELRDWTWRGRRLDITLNLPPPGSRSGEAYTVDGLLVDGQPVGPSLRQDQLYNGSSVLLTLSDPGTLTDETLSLVEDDGDFRRFWPPHDPEMPTLSQEGAGLRLDWPQGVDAGQTWDVWRDGVRIADSLSSPGWTDPSANPDGRSPCYAITAVWPSSGLSSMPSPAACWWGSTYERIQTLDAWSLAAGPTSATWTELSGRAWYRDWGIGTDTLTVDAVRPWWTGRYGLQLEYANGAGPINTGITGAAKTLVVQDAATGVEIARGTVTMPQRGTWSTWGDSTLLPVDLQADRTYTLSIVEGWNMSWLEHFRDYSGGLGGGPQPYHYVDISAIKLLPLEGDDDSPAPASLTLDGADDLDAYTSTQQLDPGAPLQPWSAFALDWDDHWLYVTLVSQGFEQDFAPWMVYLQAADTLGAPVGSLGMPYTYGSVTAPAAIPFTPTHVLALRADGSGGPQGGPWPGLWRNDAGSFTQIARLKPSRDLWVAADRHTLSARVPRASLGAGTRLRLAAHLLWGAVGGEWKDLVPATHAPWAGGGGWLEIDLDGPHPSTAWALKP